MRGCIAGGRGTVQGGATSLKGHYLGGCVIVSGEVVFPGGQCLVLTRFLGSLTCLSLTAERGAGGGWCLARGDPFGHPASAPGQSQ